MSDFTKRHSGNVQSFSQRLRNLALVVGISLGLAPAVMAAPKVVDYYNGLTKTEFPNRYLYPLTPRGNGWISQNLSWDSDIPVLVDGANGYILINDEGTGGGNFTTEAVYWNTGNGPLLGVAETGYYPPYPEYSAVQFYSRSGDKWENDTAYVWPEISLADFMTPDMTIRDLRALQAIRAAIYVKLPQKGLNAEAWLVIRNQEVNAVCNGEDWFNPGDKTPYLHYCNLLKARLFNHLEITWNKSDGVFGKGGLSRRAQPWDAQ